MGLGDYLTCGANNCRTLETERCADQLVEHAQTHYELDQSDATEADMKAAAMTTCSQVMDIKDRDVRHDAGMRIYTLELEKQVERTQKTRARALKDWGWAISAYRELNDEARNLTASLSRTVHIDVSSLKDAALRYANNMVSGALNSLSKNLFNGI